MVKGIIFDFNRTVYDPESSGLTEGAIVLLDKLKHRGYKLCLISKKTTINRRKQISDLGLDEYFMNIQVIDGDKTEQNFEKCVRVMSCNASEIAVVGDRVRKEICLGNKLGMITIWYKSGKFSEESPRNRGEEPRHIILRLEELSDIINGEKY